MSFYLYCVMTGKHGRCAAGTRSVAMIFRAVVFTFIPTAIELALVSWLLAKSFSPSVAALVIATFGAYVAWTTLMTKVLKCC